MADNVNSDEIGLKELINLLKDHYKEWLKLYWFILAITLIFVGFFGYKYFKSKTKYYSELKFAIESQSGNNSISGIGSILGSLGMASSGGYSPFQITEVAYSKLVLEKVLFQKSSCGDDYLINYIISQYKLDKKWIKNWGEEYSNFRFVNSNVKDFSKKESKAFVSVASTISGNNDSRTGLFSIEFNEYTGIFNFETKAEKECISHDITQYIFNQCKYIFETKTIQKKKESRDILKEKRDSINELIESKTSTLAYIEDSNMNVILKSGNLQKEKLLTEIKGLAAAYYELSKNYEISDIQFRDTKPMFLVLEKSYLPLSTINPSIKKSLLMGIFLGLIMGVLIVSLRKIYMDLMNE